jgi:hypothetical protein
MLSKKKSVVTVKRSKDNELIRNDPAKIGLVLRLQNIGVAIKEPKNC